MCDKRLKSFYYDLNLVRHKFPETLLLLFIVPFLCQAWTIVVID